MKTKLSREKAFQMFDELWVKTVTNSYFNRDLWKKHSMMVAKGSEILAEKLSLDAEKAFVIGLMHDIGKGINYYPKKHAIEGHKFLSSLGYDEAARVALSHDFPQKDITPSIEDKLISEEELEYLKPVLKDFEYDIYDKIVQVCDVTSYPDGFVLMEKRLLFVLMREGKLTETFKQIVNSSYDNIAFLNQKLGRSIYDYLPEVINNTFYLDGPKNQGNKK